ncbi:cytochrome-c peroxidase [Phaeocystidibacter marisrubri]|uniref:Cytochrome-c peroxidase n=1 Tax=Phaeocystidibacter marisrubri TaxID=1577780 RepID=A0A6L3ZDF6_9FLAO|nr:cytochrome c peroxidase [Phaeocystidibacter marisrubri]KAB2815676.1 cytochrome-c peroxidase [Phaeocystidibacter marisrubri]GGH65133.1 cytochrome-c peroxidase [Phaeocystidibacter marisrubri]
MKYFLKMAVLAVGLQSCQTDEPLQPGNADPVKWETITATLNIDPDHLPDYVNPSFPSFYNNAFFARFDNTPADNMISNEGATLGRVLFYDVSLSRNRSVSCASCHAQHESFSDKNQFSSGFEGGQTTVHSMRLANARFYEAGSFFWDKRSASLEEQSTQPIQNGLEMGFDSLHGGMLRVVERLDSLSYYPPLFDLAFGDSSISEDRIQKALAQFMRSIISVHSRFDEGYAQVYDPTAPGQGIGASFPNFTAQENRGKAIFLGPPNTGGAGCAGCHVPPAFTLVGVSLSNGLDAGETTVFKSPSLKTIDEGQHFMHDGRFSTLAEVVEHYDNGIQNGPALDPRLRVNGQPLVLNLTMAQKADLIAFLLTLSDPTVLADSKYSDPFK